MSQVQFQGNYGPSKIKWKSKNGGTVNLVRWKRFVLPKVSKFKEHNCKWVNRFAKNKSNDHIVWKPRRIFYSVGESRSSRWNIARNTLSQNAETATFGQSDVSCLEEPPADVKRNNQTQPSVPQDTKNGTREIEDDNNEDVVNSPGDENDSSDSDTGDDEEFEVTSVIRHLSEHLSDFSFKPLSKFQHEIGDLTLDDSSSNTPTQTGNKRQVEEERANVDGSKCDDLDENDRHIPPIKKIRIEAKLYHNYSLPILGEDKTHPPKIYRSLSFNQIRSKFSPFKRFLSQNDERSQDNGHRISDVSGAQEVKEQSEIEVTGKSFSRIGESQVETFKITDKVFNATSPENATDRIEENSPGKHLFEESLSKNTHLEDDMEMDSSHYEAKSILLPAESGIELEEERNDPVNVSTYTANKAVSENSLQKEPDEVVGSVCDKNASAGEETDTSKEKNKIHYICSSPRHTPHVRNPGGESDCASPICKVISLRKSNLLQNKTKVNREINNSNNEIEENYPVISLTSPEHGLQRASDASPPCNIISFRKRSAMSEEHYESHVQTPGSVGLLLPTEEARELSAPFFHGKNHGSHPPFKIIAQTNSNLLLKRNQVTEASNYEVITEDTNDQVGDGEETRDKEKLRDADVHFSPTQPQHGDFSIETCKLHMDNLSALAADKIQTNQRTVAEKSRRYFSSLFSDESQVTVEMDSVATEEHFRKESADNLELKETSAPHLEESFVSLSLATVHEDQLQKMDMVIQSYLMNGATIHTGMLDLN